MVVSRTQEYSSESTLGPYWATSVMLPTFLTGYSVVHGDTAIGDSSFVIIWSTDYDPHVIGTGFQETTNNDVAHANDYHATIFTATRGI
jgi:hypothetical protein